ncbi:MAG: amidohydrolase family protein [Candidatus Woesearchaeota archaeon]
MIIDAHTHIDLFSDEFISPEQRVNNLKEFMKEAGIDQSLIFCLTPSLPKVLTQDQILNLISGEKNLFIVGTISIIKHTKKDLLRLEEGLKQKKIVAIKLYTGYEAFYPTDKRCEPVYALGEKYDVPVIFHTGDTYQSKVPIKYAHPLNIDELALKRPNLKIILAHCGNPWIEDAILVMGRNKNVYGDISGWTWGSFHSREGKFLRSTFERILGWCGPDKILFGTDWPCNHPSMYSSIHKEYVQFVKSFKLSKEEEEKIFYQNAQRLFKI